MSFDVIEGFYFYEHCLLVKTLHDSHDESCIKNIVQLVIFRDILEMSWEQLQDCSFSVLLWGNVHREVFSEENLSWIFLLRSTRIVYCVLDIISEKCTLLSQNFASHDFVYFLCIVQSEEDL